MLLAPRTETMATSTLMRLQRALRERAEAVDLAVHAPLSSVTRAGYRRWVCDLYRFVSAFETSFAFTPGLDIRFIHARMKAGLLSSDLMVLGLTRRECARLTNRYTVPRFDHHLEALGWLFVVERLTLQLDHIRMRLQPTLELELDAAGSFFDVYEGATADAWESFGRVLDRCVADDSDMDMLVAAARTALDALESCVADPVTSTVAANINATSAA